MDSKPSALRNHDLEAPAVGRRCERERHARDFDRGQPARGVEKRQGDLTQDVGLRLHLETRATTEREVLGRQDEVRKADRDPVITKGHPCGVDDSQPQGCTVERLENDVARQRELAGVGPAPPCTSAEDRPRPHLVFQAGPPDLDLAERIGDTDACIIGCFIRRRGENDGTGGEAPVLEAEAYTAARCGPLEGEADSVELASRDGERLLRRDETLRMGDESLDSGLEAEEAYPALVIRGLEDAFTTCWRVISSSSLNLALLERGAACRDPGVALPAPRQSARRCAHP